MFQSETESLASQASIYKAQRYTNHTLKWDHTKTQVEIFNVAKDVITKNLSLAINVRNVITIYFMALEFIWKFLLAAFKDLNVNNDSNNQCSYGNTKATPTKEFFPVLF